MKQVININFQGRVVPIEVTAFEVLKKYIESLNRHFANEEGKEEIINDIENRIGELFQSRLKDGSTCITEDDVAAIIKSMGRPEEFDAEQPSGMAGETGSASATGPAAAPFISVKGKRLYRDENHKVIGGVCSGLANYFGIDVVVVRVIFVILAFAGGLSFLPYLILWIAVPSTASTVIGSPRKKLYRDPDDKIIAGVGSGIGNYFGINPWIPRALFLLPAISLIINNDDFDVFRFGFSPGSLIIYIILWLVIPEAATTAEKLEMKGEKVDMNSIKNSVMEEMKGVQSRAEKLGREAKAVAMERGSIIGSDAAAITRRGSRSLGDIIVFLFKIFAYFILGIIIISIIVSLFALAIFTIGIFPLKDFVLNDGWQNVFAWGTLIFFIAVPIIGIITWLIRRIAKIKSGRRTMRLSFFSLWFIGLVCFISLIVSVSREFDSSNDLIEEEIALITPGVSKLEVTSDSPVKRFYRNNWFRMEPFIDLNDDTAYVKNVRVQIVKSTNDSFRVTMLRLADGPDNRSANMFADMIKFDAYQQDSVLMIDRGIPITKKDKFRNQQVVLTVYVPVGKTIRIDRSVGWSDNVRFHGPFNDWRDVNYDLDIQHGWETDQDYIMKADGLYTLDGEPASSWKRTERRTNININGRGVNVTIDEPGTNEDENYRYDDNNIQQPVIDSAKIREEIRIKDSTDKQNKIKSTGKAKKSGTEETAMVNSYNGYNPMLLILN